MSSLVDSTTSVMKLDFLNFLTTAEPTRPLLPKTNALIFSPRLNSIQKIIKFILNNITYCKYNLRYERSLGIKFKERR